MQKRTKISIVIIILAFIIAGIFLLINKNTSIAYEVTLVKRGDVIQEVLVFGAVVPSKKIDLQFKNSGKISQIPAQINDKVKINQVLAALDINELNAQLLEKQAALSAAQARLELLLAGASPEEIQISETKILNAKIALANAEQNFLDIKKQGEQNLKNAYQDNLDILKDVYIKSEYVLNKQTDEMFDQKQKLTFLVSDSQAKIDSEWQKQLADYALQKLKTETELNKAKNNLIIIREFLLRLNDALNSAISYEADVNSALTSINAVISNITNQEQNIALLELTNQADINSAQARIDTAKANLQTAQDELTLKKAGARDVDIALHQAQIEQAEANLLLVQAKIQNAILRSPISGIVTDVNYEAGEIINLSKPVISLISSKNFQIEAEIPEADIAKIEINNKTKIELDAFPDEIWQGKVIAVEPAERIVEGVAYYKTIIAFDEFDKKIKSGMSADINIQTDKRENILFVPQRAVNNKKIKILASKIIKEVQVQTGLLGSDGNIEIISGLAEGDKIINFIKKK